MGWTFLVAAILAEVATTLSLRAAATRSRAWYAAVVVGYVLALGLLSLALAHGLSLGVAYGIWTASGVALVAVACRLLFHEPLTWVMSMGMGLIVIGVLLIKFGSTS
ncbi:DMT family transporter [Kocuria aegyptia]|uniref:DMT family transporter n=1 Tax=Kocuria aegyptia TaxID=330943 RepID=UPI0031D96ED3